MSTRTPVNELEKEGLVQPPASQLETKSKTPEALDLGDQNQTENQQRHDDDAELEPFDFEDLNNRYLKALTEANEVEDKLYDEFDRYADAFQAWAEASAGKDNKRAQKRLKTKVSFLELSEQDLELQKQHYNTVVNAFKNALTLLQSSTQLPRK